MDIATIPTSFEHQQVTPSDTWVINHDLNRVPVVDVYIDVSGLLTRILPSITYDGTASVTITFSEPQTGIAALI